MRTNNEQKKNILFRYIIYIMRRWSAVKCRNKDEAKRESCDGCKAGPI